MTTLTILADSSNNTRAFHLANTLNSKTFWLCHNVWLIFMRRVRCEQDAFLRDFCKGITFLVIGIAKSRKNTSIATPYYPTTKIKWMRRVRCEQDAFLRDFCKGITLSVIGIAKSRKNTSIAKYITLRISVTSWDIAINLNQTEGV